MKNSKTLLEKFEKLERMAGSIAEEVAVLSYCRANGLNYNDTADCAEAEKKVHFSRYENRCGSKAKNSNKGADKMPISDCVDRPQQAVYNGVRESGSTADEDISISMYSWLSSINRLRHSVQQKLIGRVVVNRTGVRIAVMAQPKAARNTTVAVYLAPGESSADKYEDVDAIMIARGQRFYKSKADAMAKNKEIVEEGAIKVHDGPQTAEVRHTPGNPTVFYVDASDSIYFKENHYPDNRWRLP